VQHQHLGTLERHGELTFVEYVKPLIGTQSPKVPLEDGLLRFARLQSVSAPAELPLYVPQGHRPGNEP